MTEAAAKRKKNFPSILDFYFSLICTSPFLFPFTPFPHSTFRVFPEWWTCTTDHVFGMTKMCSGSSTWLWRHQCGPCGQLWRHHHCQSLSVKCAPPAIISACHPLHHVMIQLKCTNSGIHNIVDCTYCIKCIV